MIRNALTVLLVLALAGCGFHLRNKLALPADTPPVQVVTTTPFIELATILERTLRTANFSWAPADWPEPSPWLRMLRNARAWLG